MSSNACVYAAENTVIGINVRIDDFCVLSCKIEIQNYIYIAAYSAFYGGTKGRYVNDFANISSRVSIYAILDDYFGKSMTIQCF